MKVAVICSEFNKELVEDLYQQAYQEFEKYQLQAQKLLSQSSSALSQSLLQESSVDLQFIQGQSELKKWTKFLPLNQKESLIQRFMEKVANGEIEPYWVPGAGEIPLTAQWLIEEKIAQAILALGVIIKGQTAHYDFLCGFFTKGFVGIAENLFPSHYFFCPYGGKPTAGGRAGEKIPRSRRHEKPYPDDRAGTEFEEQRFLTCIIHF